MNIVPVLIRNKKIAGVMLSLIGDIVINIGMNSMKHAHNINTNPETGKPFKHFTLIPWWWVGILGIIGGEVGNLIAYGYAPASIVTPIGSIGVVTNVIITTFVLKEPFTMKNLLGVVLVMIGIVVVVLFAPLTVVFVGSDNLWRDVLFTPNFAFYLGWMAIMLMILYPVSLKYGEKSVVIYVSMCAVIASLTIVTAKTFSTMVSNGFKNGMETEFLSPWPYATLIVMVITCVLSMGYVNKAMMVFGNSQVVPVYFALFTTAGVGSAAWVYYEFQCLADARQAVLFFMGILIAIMGVFLVSTGGTSKVQPADAQDVAMRKKGDVEMGEAGGDEGGAQHEQGYTAGLDEGSDVQGKDGSVSSHTREGPISGEASIPSTPLGPDGSSRRLAGIQCADTEVCGQGKGCSVDVHTPGTIRQVSGGQLSVQVEGDDVRSPPRGALLASAGALIQDGHHRHPPPTNYTPHLATQGVREATLPPQPDTGASASPCSRRRREKQMKEGRCGLNQLKPLPPLTSPNGGCAGAGSRFT